MNNNTKLFGVLVAALFAFGAIGASAQGVFNTFVEFGDWEYDIGDDNVYEYCTFNGTAATQTCFIYTTNANGDYTKGDLYLANNSDETAGGKIKADTGFLRLFNSHGFDAGTLVQDGDADDGAQLYLATAASIGYVQTIADDKLQNAELASMFVSNKTTVTKDDLSLAENARIGSNHDLVGATLTYFTEDEVGAGWVVYFADLDADAKHDEDEPLFLDVDKSGDDGVITVGDLALSGDDFFSLVSLQDPFLANPVLISIDTGFGGEDFFLAIQTTQANYNENGYRGESILLVRNATDGGFSEPRIGEGSFVLTGSRQGELIEDGHPLFEARFANMDHAGVDEEVVICALVDDYDDDPVTFMAPVYFHFDNDDCDDDPDDGDVNIVANQVLGSNSNMDGEFSHLIDGDVFATGDSFNQTAWFVLDLNNNGEIDAGEPVVLDADGTTTLTTLDLVISTDGALLAGPGYHYMSPASVPLIMQETEATLDTYEVQYCTYYEEEEDENGNDIFVPYAILLRAQHWADEEGACEDEDEAVQGDFVLAGDRHVGSFLTEDTADDFEEDFAIGETDAGQFDYELAYDDIFPSGFGPEDIVFIYPAAEPRLEAGSFYLGGEAIKDGDEYWETRTSDLVKLADTDSTFELIEGDNRKGLSEADWFYLTFNGEINDNTLILYKGSSPVGEEPTPTATPTVTPTTEPTTEPTVEPTEPTKKQPGFEAIALIAALGAALVLVRRRD